MCAGVRAALSGSDLVYIKMSRFPVYDSISIPGKIFHILLFVLSSICHVGSGSGYEVMSESSAPRGRQRLVAARIYTHITNLSISTYRRSVGRWTCQRRNIYTTGI